jgi:hypothetical protein
MVDAIACSPPYAEAVGSPALGGRRRAGWGRGGDICARQGLTADYGTTPGQLGALPAGDVGAVVTSPPWSAQMHEGGDTPAARGVGRNGRDQRPCEARGEHNPTRVYGDTAGQVGRESGETYWAACKQIYLECLKCLKPGGVLACVVKGYVRDGALVDLPGQTLRLLRALGFGPVERIRAWLTEERREAGLFGEVVTTKSRQSFFRRLAEKRGAPPIRWEEVLVVRKEG